MNWTNINVPEIPEDESHNFATQAYKKAQQFFPDLSERQTISHLKNFLEDEIIFLKQAEAHHSKWSDFYHLNVALSNQVEQQAFTSILTQIESLCH